MTEKRFKEIISTQKVIDTQTGKEYDCLLDNDFYDLVNSLAEENEQLKKDRFICLDCEHSGYTEIGCLCEYDDHWVGFMSECEDFKELREY